MKVLEFIKRHHAKIIIAICSSIYLFFVFKANFQLLNHPYAWSTDEIADMETIEKIHQIDGIKPLYGHFVKNQINDIHGAITMYIPAFVSAVPRAVWGERAVMYVFRMVASLLLIASYFILIFGFIKKPFLQISLFLMLIALPYTGMFMTWPRCESYLFFFYSLFLLRQFQTGYRSSSSYFFLGIAFISRISVGVFIPFLLLFSFYIPHTRLKERFLRSLRNCAWIVLGIVTADPYLLKPANVMSFINRKLFLIYEDTGVKDWINFDYWIREVSDIYFGTTPIFIFVMVAALSIVFISTYISLKTPAVFTSKNGVVDLWFFACQVLMSILGVVIIALEVKTDTFWYWHFYLAIGCFSITSIIGILVRSKLRKTLEYTTLTVSIFFMTRYLSDHPYLGHKLKIEDSEPFKEKVLEYKMMKKNLKKICQSNQKQLFVRVLADQFQIESESCYKVEAYWRPGPFHQLSERTDIIFFNYTMLKPGSAYNLQKDGDWRIKKTSEKNYRKWMVKSWGGDCNNGKGCFSGKMLTKNLIMVYREGLKIGR